MNPKLAETYLITSCEAETQDGDTRRVSLQALNQNYHGYVNDDGVKAPVTLFVDYADDCQEKILEVSLTKAEARHLALCLLEAVDAAR